MKYMMLIAGDEASWNDQPAEAARELYERVKAWWGEQEAAGRIVEGHELEPSTTATTVRIAPDRTTTVTDGPFLEGKEMVGGYAIVECADLDEALALAASWPMPDTLEIRPLRNRAG